MEEQRQASIQANLLGKRTRTRLEDVFRRTFLPRFVHGPIPNAWKLVRPLEDAGASGQTVRPVYFWITARAEPLIYDFCAEYLQSRRHLVQDGIRTPDVVSWLRSKGCNWTSTVTQKVARGILAALRDFGLLEGHAVKRLAPVPIQVASFAYIARCMYELGVQGPQLVESPDWAIFLLEPRDVEHLFLEAHQRQLLQYLAAGSVVNIEFPAQTLQEYAYVVTERAD